MSPIETLLMRESSESPDRSQTEERWKGGASSDVPGSKAIIDQAAGRVAASSDSPSVFIGSVVACGCKNLRSSWMERLKRPTASAVAQPHSSCPLTAETSSKPTFRSPVWVFLLCACLPVFITLCFTQFVSLCPFQLQSIGLRTERADN